MDDDFDDDAVGMPDDDLTGGGDLGDLDIEGEEAGVVELDLEGGEPTGRPGGGARARARAARVRPGSLLPTGLIMQSYGSLVPRETIGYTVTMATPAKSFMPAAVPTN